MLRGTTRRFTDRRDAGRRLGRALRRLHLVDPVVFALPRGGAAVGVEVAAALDAPLDLVLVRKLGAPEEPELALGAVAEGGEMVLNPEVVAATGASEAFIAAVQTAALEEIGRRRDAWLAERPRIAPGGRSAVLVDDGLATGATARAALRALRGRGAARLVLAVPVAAASALAALRPEADDIICLIAAAPFRSVGAFYRDFRQLEDAEVTHLLGAAVRRGGRGA